MHGSLCIALLHCQTPFPLSAYAPLRENLTLSTKPEVHKVLHCHQSRIKQQAQATDVCANFTKSCDTKTRPNIKNLARSSLDIVSYFKNLPAPIVNGRGNSFWKRPDFQIWRARDLDLGLGHTAYRRASLVNLYAHANFTEIKETFCGRTDVCTYVRTFETGFIRSTLSKSQICKVWTCDFWDMQADISTFRQNRHNNRTTLHTPLQGLK